MSHRPLLYCTHRPGPPLDRFVEQLWYWEGMPPAHAKDRLIPSGSSGLMINLVEDETRYTAELATTSSNACPAQCSCGAYSRYS